MLLLAIQCRMWHIQNTATRATSVSERLVKLTYVVASLKATDRHEISITLVADRVKSCRIIAKVGPI